MDRRTAMFLTLLMGGLAPRSLRAQTAGRRASTSGANSDSAKGRTRGAKFEPARPRGGRDDEVAEDRAAAELPGEDEAAPNLPPEPGHQWRNFDIADYTSLAHSQNNPQTAIVDW